LGRVESKLETLSRMEAKIDGLYAQIEALKHASETPNSTEPVILQNKRGARALSAVASMSDEVESVASALQDDGLSPEEVHENINFLSAIIQWRGSIKPDHADTTEFESTRRYSERPHEGAVVSSLRQRRSRSRPRGQSDPSRYLVSSDSEPETRPWDGDRAGPGRLAIPIAPKHSRSLSRVRKPGAEHGLDEDLGVNFENSRWDDDREQESMLLHSSSWSPSGPPLQPESPRTRYSERRTRPESYSPNLDQEKVAERSRRFFRRDPIISGVAFHGSESGGSSADASDRLSHDTGYETTPGTPRIAKSSRRPVMYSRPSERTPHGSPRFDHPLSPYYAHSGTGEPMLAPAKGDRNNPFEVPYIYTNEDTEEASDFNAYTSLPPDQRTRTEYRNSSRTRTQSPDILPLQLRWPATRRDRENGEDERSTTPRGQTRYYTIPPRRPRRRWV
jgi:hypothetical protein